MQEIYALITAAGHLTNVAKTAFQTHSKVETDAARIELGEAIIELQGKISALQATYQTMVDANQELKQRIASFDQWAQESARYHLVPVSKSGSFVYALKEPMPGEMQHWVCPTCFEDRKKLILQPNNLNQFTCPRCKTIIMVTAAFPNIVCGQDDIERLEPDAEKLLLRFANAEQALTRQETVDGMGFTKGRADYLYDQLEKRHFIRMEHGDIGDPIAYVASPSGRQYLHKTKLLK